MRPVSLPPFPASFGRETTSRKLRDRGRSRLPPCADARAGGVFCSDGGRSDPPILRDRRPPPGVCATRRVTRAPAPEAPSRRFSGGALRRESAHGGRSPVAAGNSDAPPAKFIRLTRGVGRQLGGHRRSGPLTRPRGARPPLPISPRRSAPPPSRSARSTLGPGARPPLSPLDAAEGAIAAGLASRTMSRETLLRSNLGVGWRRSPVLRWRLRGEAPETPDGSSQRLSAGARGPRRRLRPYAGGRSGRQEVRLGTSERAESRHHHEAAWPAALHVFNAYVFRTRILARKGHAGHDYEKCVERRRRSLQPDRRPDRAAELRSWQAEPSGGSRPQ